MTKPAFMKLAGNKIKIIILKSLLGIEKYVEKHSDWVVQLFMLNPCMKQLVISITTDRYFYLLLFKGQTETN